MTLPAWLDVAEPQPDIADGSFDESLFAADLGLVDRGLGPADYRDPVAFCAKTYLTENLQAVLAELIARLDDDPAAAGVYRLQTEFGGGKTHTLLAAYHLFREPARVSGTPLYGELCDSLGRSAIPQARVAVLDGSALTPGTPEPTPDGAALHSLLGQLAYRLGGKAAYERVAEQDRGMLGSSTAQLVELLDAHAPCLVLLDELLQYLSKALAVRTHDGNLAGTTLTFIKELCTAAANVPKAAVLATLTSSHLEDYASVAGAEMQERLSKVVGRTENIVTPVEGDDIFPILHRRLFAALGDDRQRQQVAEAYADYYDSLGDAVPATYREASYRTRLARAYPFHPELVDILTNRWGSLSGFQRTRGALRTLAHTVKALSRARSKAPLIHPGDVLLADAGVRGEVIRFAGESYKAALNADIIRSDSKAAEEDRRRGGVVADFGVACGLATTAFLNSFGSDRVLGASAAQMLLGVGRPGLSRGVIDDVRDALEGSLWYLRLEGGRYRFTTEPNLNKVVVEREGAIGEDRIRTLLAEAIGAVSGSGPLRIVFPVSDSTDLPDEPQLTLGLLDLDHRVEGTASDSVRSLADEILARRGSAFRVNRNAAMLLAADGPALAKARGSARTLGALRDLQADRHRMARFNAEQREQLSKRLAGAESRLPQQLVMAFRHLFLLGDSGNGPSALDHVDLGPARPSAQIAGRVLDYLRGADRLVDTTLAPAALLAERFGLLPEGSDAVELDTLLGYFARLPRLPKIAGPEVLRTALSAGVQQGLFGLTSGRAWNAEDAVVRFREPVQPSEIQFQPGMFLVRASAARAIVAARQTEPTQEASGDESQRPPAEPQKDEPTATQGTGDSTRPSAIRRVSITVDHVPASKVRDVVKVAVHPLASAGADVAVGFTVTADAGGGTIPRDTLSLTVTEGLRQLGVDFDVTESD